MRDKCQAIIGGSNLLAQNVLYMVTNQRMGKADNIIPIYLFILSSLLFYPCLLSSSFSSLYSSPSLSH